MNGNSAPHPALSSIGGEGIVQSLGSMARRPKFNGNAPGILAREDVEPWPEPVDGAALLEDLCQMLTRFVVLPKWGAEALALWIVHTYAFHLRDVSTYIGLESPEKRCGKTTLLTVLSELVNRPVVAANISSPAFFRVIEETQPTLLIDEADTFLQGNDELRGILNSGYTRKTAYVVRVSPLRIADCGLRIGAESQEEEIAGARAERASINGTRRPREASRLARFSFWCPKVMAAIGRLPETLADRCVVIRMQRKLSGEQCERLRNLDATEWRRKCVRFVRDHEGAIASARPQIPEALNDRAGDIWEPLLALADLAGGRWPQLSRQAAEGLTAIAQESNPIAALLFDLLVLFGKFDSERLFSRDIVHALNLMADRSWAEMNQGRPVTELWLAQRLRPYGVRPKTLWIGERAGKGYCMEDFSDVFRRYIPRSEIETGLARNGIQGRVREKEHGLIETNRTEATQEVTPE